MGVRSFGRKMAAAIKALAKVDQVCITLDEYERLCFCDEALAATCKMLAARGEEVARLKNELAIESDQRARCERQRDGLAADLRASTARCEALSEANEQTAKALQGECDTLGGKLHEALAEAERVRRELAARDGEVDDLRAEVCAEEQASATEHRANEAADAELQRLLKENAELARDRVALIQQRDALVGECAELRSQRAADAKSFANMREKWLFSDTARASLYERAKRLEALAAEYHRERDDLQRALDAMKAEGDKS